MDKAIIAFEELKLYVESSVLCWLATSSRENIPNVSPKEIFNIFDSNTIIIASIASPGSIKNIKENANVCLSFIDVLVQKGLQLHGTATLVTTADPRFTAMESILLKMTDGKFPFSEIISIDITNRKRIIAPKYLFYPETTVVDQIASAKESYGLG